MNISGIISPKKFNFDAAYVKGRQAFTRIFIRQL